MTTIKHGLNITPADDRDFPLGAIVDLPALDTLPPFLKLKTLGVKDQKDTDFCSAFATDLLSEMQERTELCSEWGFAASKEISGDADDYGQDLRTALKRHLKYGGVNRYVAPYSLENKSAEWLRRFDNWPDLSIPAAEHKKKSYFKVTGPHDHYDNLRASLVKYQANQQGAVMGIIWHWDIRDKTLLGISDDGTGHAIAIIGYSLDGLILQNSAGLGAGDGGCHILPRKEVNYYVEKYGAYMLVDLSAEEAKQYLDAGVKMDQTWIIKAALLLLYRLKSFFLAHPDAKPTDVVPEVPVVQPEPAQPAPAPVVEPKVYLLDKFCLAIRDFEGSPGDRNYRNNNPGNCRYSSVGYDKKYGVVGRDKDNFAIFRDYETGWMYLQNLVRGKIAAHPQRTIREFFYEYAPTNDGNDPEAYAAHVAKRLAVGVDFIIKNLL